MAELPAALTSPGAAMARLGGTIKLASEIGTGLSEGELLDCLVTELDAVDGKIHFGISIYSKEQGAKSKEQLNDVVYRWGKELKTRLKETGRSVRHVFNREAILSSVSVAKNGLTNRGAEFLVRESGGKYTVARTLAVQPFEAFGARDFGRPGRDDVSGMLPPKLALMMINLAGMPESAHLLDPFCGSGTILTEALLLGYTKLTGSDLSERAIADTRQNIAWTIEQARLALTADDVRLETTSVLELSTIMVPNSIEAIVTEPYLGKPLKGNEPRELLEAQIQELKMLYLKAFVQFKEILQPGGKIVFLLPRFKFRNEWLRIDCRAEIEALGFSVVTLLDTHDYLLYARPDQRVGREVWCFTKK